MISLDAQLEAILFTQSRPLSAEQLAKYLERSVQEIVSALGTLAERLQDRGIVLVRTDHTYALATHSDMTAKLSDMYGRDRSGELSKAALETLAIILYTPGISKPEIDHVRGVNSQYILRTLHLRGLVARKNRTDASKASGYYPTTDTLRFLGVTQYNELPRYEETLVELEKLAATAGQE